MRSAANETIPVSGLDRPTLSIELDPNRTSSNPLLRNLPISFIEASQSHDFHHASKDFESTKMHGRVNSYSTMVPLSRYAKNLSATLALSN